MIESVPLRTLAALAVGLGVFILVSLIGGFQNVILWDHALPDDFNGWGVLVLATLAGVIAGWHQWRGTLSDPSH